MRVFISYRQSDSKDISLRTADRLIDRFGERNVFIAVDSLDGGDIFEQRILRFIRRADVQIVVIGPHWVDAVDAEGKRRLDDPKDYVRLEIEAAFESRIPILPLLVDGASMPLASQLPPSIVMLAKIQGLSIHGDKDLRHDILRAGSLAKKLAAQRRWQSFVEFLRLHQRSLLIVLSCIALIAGVTGGSRVALTVIGNRGQVGTPKSTHTTIASPIPTPSNVIDWSTWQPSGQWKVVSNPQVLNGQVIENMLVSDGGAVCCSPRVIGLLSPEDVHAGNYVLDARIQVTGINPKAVRGEVYFGLLVRSDSNFNGYLMGVLDNRPTIPAGVTFQSPLGTGAGPVLEQTYPLDTDVHDYRVEAQGFTLKFFIDGKFIFQKVNDTYIQNQGVGLMDAGYQIKVLSFSLTQ